MRLQRNKRVIVLFLVIGIVLVALDLFTKWWAFDALEVVTLRDAEDRLQIVDQQVIVLVPDIFEIEATLNRGAFSGWFSNFTPYLALISFIAAFVIFGLVVAHLRRKPEEEGQEPPPCDMLFIVALAFVWGGTIGNFWDRWQLGAVRDFIKWFYKDYVWPNFNIADSAICVGVGLLFINVFRDYKREKAERSLDEKNPSKSVRRV